MLADASVFNPVLHNDYEGFPDDSVVKNPPANAGHLGSIPGLASSSGEGMATHSSILAWEIRCSEEPGRLQSMGWQKSQT